MRVLIVGAGTMGLTHGWLMSEEHDVAWLVRPDRVPYYSDPFTLKIHDLRRGRQDTSAALTPNLVTRIEPSDHDVVFVMVPGGQLPDVLPLLEPTIDALPTVFMLNHWNLAEALGSRFRNRTTSLVGFPSQVGGGRDGHYVTATVFPHGTVLEADSPGKQQMLTAVEQLFTSAGLTVRRQRHMIDWLAVHSMQQSLTAAPVIEAGSYESFASDAAAIGRLVDAFREGLDVCRARGISTTRLWPAPLFRLPRPLITRALQRMFQQPDTATMVTGHMRHGLGEWIEGLQAIYADAHRLHVNTPQIDRQLEVVTTPLT